MRLPENLRKVISYAGFLMMVIFALESFAQNQRNIELFGQFDRGDNRYSGSWAYTDAVTGKEYALLGTTTGTAIYDINEVAIKEVGFIRGPYSNWREITVIGTYAYVVTEGAGIGEGMQVIDLTALPNSVRLVTTFDTQFTTGHIISRDIYSDTAFVYISGTCGNCGVEIVDVADPATPVLVGSYRPSYYVHDCHVRGDYLYAAAFWEGTLDIVNISDKSQPFLVTRLEMPGGNTHSAWTTEDERYLIISAESDGLPARVWNIEDLENPYQVSSYTGNKESLTHNPYVKGDFVFFSHNTEGIRVVDVKDPALPVEVGYYDTFEGSSGGFNGLWSACPYFPSGKIIGGNREDGLYVWTFNETPANRVYLSIQDAVTKEPISAAMVAFPLSTDTILSDEDGQLSWGTLESEWPLSILADGYEQKDTLLVLEEGEQLTQIIELSPATVSTKFIEEANTLKIYPNPFGQQLTIEWAYLEPSQQLILLNLFNQKIATYPINSTTSFSVQTTDLPSGFYQVLVTDVDGKILMKGGVVQE